MTRSDRSLSMINGFSLMTLALIAASMISTAAAAVSCSSTSPECCWLVLSWKLMGKRRGFASHTSSTDCCSMLGVTCSGSNVTAINWTSQSLTGSIPADIGNLVNLQSLSLANNSLTGSIPADIGNLVNLQSLNLQRNQLNGSIPSTIGNLVNLTDLSLLNNQLSGSIPSTIGNLVNLQLLDLSSNQLTGDIPSIIENLVNLKVLFLYINRLSGSIPSTIGNLVNLTDLSLLNNQLSGFIPSTIGDLVKLQRLDLSGNQLNGSIPSRIGKLVNLQEIALRSNQLSGSIPSTIGKLVNLQRLDLARNQLNGSIPSRIGKLVNLQLLALRSNQLSGSIPSTIGKLVNLTDLYLGRNPGLTGTLTTQCTTNVFLAMTSIIICGCNSKSTPPTIYPPQGTPDNCLASGLASGHAPSLEKRTHVPTLTYEGYIFTCHTDEDYNPYADCLNFMAKICNSKITKTTSGKKTCQSSVNEIFGALNDKWEKIRKECGPWSWNGITGNPTSQGCADANLALQQTGTYHVKNPTTGVYDEVKIPLGLTDSLTVRLWNNTDLIG